MDFQRLLASQKVFNIISGLLSHTTAVLATAERLSGLWGVLSVRHHCSPPARSLTLVPCLALEGI